MTQKIQKLLSTLKTKKLVFLLIFIVLIMAGCTTLRSIGGQARTKNKSRDWLCYSACMMQPNATAFLCDRTCG
jgi:hypothetical protein